MNRPSVGDLWNGTIAVAHRHFASFAVIAGVAVFLPGQASRLLFPALGNLSMLPKMGAPPPVMPAGVWLYLIVLYAFYALGFFSIAAVAADPHEGGGRTMGAIVRSTLPAIGKAFLAALLFMLAYLLFVTVFFIVAAIIGGIFFAVTGGAKSGANPATSGLAVVIGTVIVLVLVPLMFWVSARLSPLTGVYLSEEVGVVGGIKRAWALSKGSAGTIIGIGLLITVIALVLLAGQYGMAAAGLMTGIGGFVGGLVLGLVGAVLFVYQAAGFGYLYRRLRAVETA